MMRLLFFVAIDTFFSLKSPMLETRRVACKMSIIKAKGLCSKTPSDWTGSAFPPLMKLPQRDPEFNTRMSGLQDELLGEGKWGCTKHRRIPKCEGDYTCTLLHPYFPVATSSRKCWEKSPALRERQRRETP